MSKEKFNQPQGGEPMETKSEEKQRRERERTIQWFVKPLDDFTNERITELITKTSILTEENVKSGEEKIRAYQVDHNLIQLLENSKKPDLPLKFRVFKREGTYGEVEEWKFPKRRRTVKYKKAEADLEKLSEKK